MSKLLLLLQVETINEQKIFKFKSIIKFIGNAFKTNVSKIKDFSELPLISVG